MNHIKLGKTGLMVSEIGLGGIPVAQLELDQALGTIQYAFDSGINFFDTAPTYGDSEVIFGQALESVRDKVVLATKTAKRDARGTEELLEDSLRKLRTDHIDIYQFHDLSKEEEWQKVKAPGGAMEAAIKAREDGRIGHIGFTAHSISQAVRLARTGLFSTVQIPFNFIETEPTLELLALAREMDMGVIAMKPLGGGHLERADLCFKYLQQYPEVVPIPGVEYPEQLDEILSPVQFSPTARRPGSGGDRPDQRRLGAEFLSPLLLLHALRPGGRHPHVPVFPDFQETFRDQIRRGKEPGCPGHRGRLHRLRRLRRPVPVQPAHPGLAQGGQGRIPGCAEGAFHGGLILGSDS